MKTLHSHYFFWLRLSLIFCLMLSSAFLTKPATANTLGDYNHFLGQYSKDWPFSQHDIFSSGSNSSKINLNNIQDLGVKWIAELPAFTAVSATPSVVKGVVYFPDNAGNLYAVNAKNGHVIWQRLISDYVGVPGAYSRTTPAYSDGMLFLGDQFPAALRETGAQGAHFFAVDAKTGKLIWSKVVDTNPFAIITQNATVLGDTVYVGVSSAAEFSSCMDVNPPCNFRGSVVALDKKTGKIKWQQYMTPEGYSGNAVWGTQPTIDVQRERIYVGVGNNYLGSPTPGMPHPENYFDSIVALDMHTGNVAWSFRNSDQTSDVFSIICLYIPNAECGPDFDFGMSPMLIPLNKDKDILVVGQKSGYFYGIDPNNGNLVWSSPTGPGSVLGGYSFGSATDGKYVYSVNTNFNGVLAGILGIPNTAFPLSHPAPGSLPQAQGSFALALDPATGNVVWEYAIEQLPGGTISFASISVSNGVIYLGAGGLGNSGILGGTPFSPAENNFGKFIMLKADTGEKLKEINLKDIDPNVSSEHTAAVHSAPAIVGDSIYWGAGYTNPVYFKGTGKSFYALHLKKD